MSQNSILLEKSLHFSVRIVKLHRLLHRHEDDLSAELLKHAAAIGSAVSCADCALSRRGLAESLNEALRETAQTEYWLRLLTLTGYMPDLIACRACGGLPEDGVVLFDPTGGSICCPGCAPSGAVGLLPLPPGVFAAMRHIIYCDFEKLFQFKLGEENLPVLAHAVEQYLLCQVERILPALNFYKTICI